MAIPAGLEPTTPCLEGGFIIQYIVVLIGIFKGYLQSVSKSVSKSYT